MLTKGDDFPLHQTPEPVAFAGTARGDEMFAVMSERPARQALDLGSLDLLRH